MTSHSSVIVIRTQVLSLIKYLKRRIKSDVTITTAALFFITSCSPTAQMVANKNQFTSQVVRGDKFLIQTYQKITNPDLPYEVYIEGDGLAFKHGAPSEDPTPIHPTMLKLATLDKRPNVVYIARPCQYLLKENGSTCNYHYWTDKRMSEDSIVAMNDVVTKVTHGMDIDLIGFSGGGAVAVLVAARNPDVRSIITVAGNLDHVAFNKYHHVKPMTASLNAIDYVSQVNKIPQLHLSGADDKTVPSFISADFVSKVGSKCASREVIASTSHQEGWEKIWPSIASRKLTCD